MAKFIFIIVFIVFGIGITYYFMRPSDEVPVGFVSPAEIAREHPEMVAEDLRNVGTGHRIGSFSFTDQKGNQITEADVNGKVHIAEYFFTTCGSICPKMNKQMKRVNEKFHDSPNVKILSFTVDPDYDKVDVMKAYADGYGVKGNNWHFLTGDKAKLYDLARRSYFVLKPAEAKNQGDAGSDFIHTNNFVLVDQQGRIRKYYDGTSKKEVDQLILDIQTVLNEKQSE